MKILVFIFLFWSFAIFSQQEIYKNYTVEDGLPSSEVYYSFQDSKGYMWFATDAGVSRFNGYEFENFTTKDGLSDNTVFKITEDSKGRIWFAPFNGRFCYYYNKVITEPEYLKNVSDKIGDFGFLESFYVDSLDNLWVGGLYFGIYCVSKQGELKQMIKLPKNQALRTKAIQVENEIVVGSLLTSDGLMALTLSYLTSISYLKEILIEEENPLRIGRTGDVSKVSAGANFICYTKGSNLWVLDEVGKETKYSIPLIGDGGNKGIYLHVKGSIIYLGIENHGVLKFSYKYGKLSLLRKYLEGVSVSNVFIDKTNGVWYTTLANGVYYLGKNTLSTSLLPSKSVYNLAVDKTSNVLYVSLRNGDLFEITDSTKLIEKLELNLLSIYFSEENEALYWGSLKDSSLVMYQDGMVESINNSIKLAHFKSMEVKDSVLYTVNSSGVLTFTDTSFFDSYLNSKIKLRCSSLAFHNNQLWIGTKNGLRILNGEIIIKPLLPNDYQNLSITSMSRINDSLLVVGTKAKGVLFIENGEIKKNINERSGLVSDIVRFVHVDNSGVVWCGTNKGLTRVTKDKEGDYICYNITKKHGLASEEIKSIKSNGNTIFVGTGKGVYVIESDELKMNVIPPELYIKNFEINSIKKSRKELNQLNYNDNNITIEYLGINYQSQGKINYKYRLKGTGTDTNWVSTQTRFVQYTLLPPSEYLFEVKAENEDGFWSEPIQIPFYISPPYWQTWWFICFVLLFLILIITWIIYSFFKRKQLKLTGEAKQVELEKKMIELELKALRSQMNPHFIFNILNSIQHYMLQNNFKETNRYLTQFAKLIRTVLNLSEKNIITIGEEIEMLRLYMSLEKMRFENGFDYEIVLGEEVDEDYDEIPSMLIQPYVENAIWHGLMNKKSKGKISIFIDIEDDYLCCIIEDNGIGLQKAKEIKAKRKQMKHKSIGMRVTKDRLDLLNDNSEISVKIIDLSIANLNETGTRIEIKIPYNNI